MKVNDSHLLRVDIPELLSRLREKLINKTNKEIQQPVPFLAGKIPLKRSFLSPCKPWRYELAGVKKNFISLRTLSWINSGVINTGPDQFLNRDFFRIRVIVHDIAVHK